LIHHLSGAASLQFFDRFFMTTAFLLSNARVHQCEPFRNCAVNFSQSALLRWVVGR
jgi:hypothetical protein